jgi:hypothetical protein
VDGVDDFRVFGIELDALAQFRDVLVEGPGVGQVIDAPTGSV